MMNVAAAAALVLGTSTLASAQTIRLTAVLSGSNETPASVVTGATGTAEVFVNLATQSVTYTVNVFNLPSSAVGGHFRGRPRRGRPVVIDLAPPANVSNDFTLSGTVAQSALRVRGDEHPHVGGLHPVAHRRPGVREHPQRREPRRRNARPADGHPVGPSIHFSPV
jgi:hypothetical protein